MNGQINNYFLNSQFSMAAYAEGLFSGISDSDYRIALLDANFSESQASQFLSSYQIVDQYTDPATGFSARFSETVQQVNITSPCVVLSSTN